MNLPWVQWVHIGSRLLPVWYCDLGLILIFLSPLLLSACIMARGQEETSTSQAGRRQGPSLESPSASSIISSLSMDEVRSYCQILEDIDFELLEGPAESTVDEEHNAVFFTRKHLTTGLRFPVSSLVKQFLHFTRAPPAYIHPNVIRILTGGCVLNLFYQLDLSLVEVCFAYTLRLVQGGRLSLSAQSPRLQFVTRLPDSPKSEVKGVILVMGPWDETPGSPDLPFLVNRSTSFPGVQCVCFYTPTFYVREPYYCVLLVQGKAGGVNWSIGWRRPVLKKSISCWRFSSGSNITKSFLLWRI